MYINDYCSFKNQLDEGLIRSISHNKFVSIVNNFFEGKNVYNIVYDKIFFVRIYINRSDHFK